MSSLTLQEQFKAVDLAIQCKNIKLLLILADSISQNYGNNDLVVHELVRRLLSFGLFASAERFLSYSLQSSSENSDSVALIAYIYLHSFRQQLSCQKLTQLPVDSSHLMALAYQYGENSFSARLLAEQWFSRIASINKPKYVHGVSTPRSTNVGFVSPDLCQHPVGLFLLPLVEQLSRLDNINLFFYDLKPRNDWLTLKLKKLGSVVDVQNLDDSNLANRIQNDHIAVLIDLAGHTAGNRLHIFQLRCAPVQLSWLGYWATTGIPDCFDGIISDHLLVPSDSPEECSFVEPILRLPHSRWCYQPVPWMPKNSLPPCLINGFVTFGSFNSSPKLNNVVFETWSTILHRVPDSRLYLKNYQFIDEELQQSALQNFNDLGISSERIILQGPSSHADLLAEYRSIDIALDTFPFNGGLTSCEALWLGLPLVSLLSVNTSAVMASRQGYSILEQIDRSDWCASSIDQYIDIAVNLSQDFSKLESIRLNQRPLMRKSSLCNSRLFSQDFMELIYSILRNKGIGVVSE